MDESQLTPQFQQVFDHAPIGMAIVGLDERLLLVNQALCQMLGYTADELCRLTVPDITHPDDIALEAELKQSTIADHRESFRLVKRYRHKDGRVVWGQLSVSVVTDAAGNPQHFIGQLEDVTERKQAEEALRASEAQYRLLVEHQSDLVVKVDPDGRFLFVSPSYCRLFGRREEELLGRKFMPLVHEADREATARAMESLFHPPHTATVEQRALTAHGWRWIAWADQAVLDDTGAVTAIVGVGRDVTERVQADAALQRRLALEETIAAITSRFVGATDLHETIEWSLAAMGAFSRASRAYLFHVSADGATMDNTHEWCAPGVAPQQSRLQGLATDAFPWWMAQLRQNRIIHVLDVAEMPPAAAAEKEMLEQQEIKSLLVLPLRTGQTLTGFVGFDNVQATGEWQEEDVALLRLFAEVLLSALARLQTMAALQASESRFRSLVEQSPFSTVIYSPDGRPTMANRAFAELWGVSPEGVAYLVENYNILTDPELEAQGVMPYVRTGFAGEVASIPPIVYEPQGNPLVADMVTRRRRIQGYVYPVKDSQGAVREVVLIHEDVTRRHEAEAARERYRRRLELLRVVDQAILASGSPESVAATALEHMRDLVPYSRASVVLIDATAGTAHILASYAAGTTELPAGIELPLTHFTAGQSAIRDEPYVIPDLAAYEDPPPVAQQLQQEGILAVAGVPLLSSEGLFGALYVGTQEPMEIGAEALELMREVAGSLAIGIRQARLTAQIRAYTTELEQRVAERTRELTEANERLRELDRLRSKFVSDVSHELRTPVTNLLMYLDLLERGAPERAPHYRSVLREQAERLRLLVQDALDLSRLDLAKESWQALPVDFHHLVAQTVAAFQDQARAKGLQLSHRREGGSLVVPGVEEELMRAVGCLLANAVSYTPAGHVVVRTGPSESANEVRVTVQDTGIGLSDSDRQHCFDAFYRGQEVGQLNIPGAGLGLTIAREIVLWHQGRIQVASVPGQGSTFTIYLPIRPGQ